MSKHFVYYNLHKHVWSVKGCKSGLVEHHSDTAILTDCEFKVSKAGRARVLKEKRKNVHAGVKGIVSTFDLGSVDFDEFIEITYNPYKYSSFVVKATGVAVNNASLVVMHKKRVFAKEVE